MANEIAVTEMGAAVAMTGANAMMIQTREMTEIQAMVISAKRFPRDMAQVRADILASCDSPALAEVSQYTYSKGGTEINGPSIRLAEEIANAFTNIDKGWVELERRQGVGNVPGESVVQCFAWDMQRNVKAKRTFTVRHWRDTKQGGYALKDEREIYELMANQAARRLRACILEVVPKFIQEEAVTRCDETLAKATGPMDKKIAEMLTYFAKINVTKEMIEKRIQHKAEATNQTEYIALQKIYRSIVDGMSTAAQWFEGAPAGQATAAPASEPAPATQSIAKKEKKAKAPAENTVGPQGPEMDREAKKSPAAPKNHATPEALAERKAAPSTPEPAFDVPSDPPPAEDPKAPTFKEIWDECAAACRALGWSPVRMAEFTKEKVKKSPAELQRTNDVKTLADIYAMLLQLEKEDRD